MSAPRFSIGPLTNYADPGELERLFRAASPGDEFVYAIGPALGAKAPAAMTAARLAAEGGTLVQKRDGKVFRYIIRKKAGAAASVSAATLDAPARRLLAVLAARAGEPCPSYAELAELADLGDGEPGRQAARYQLRLLVARGLVMIEVVDGQRMHRVSQVPA